MIVLYYSKLFFFEKNPVHTFSNFSGVELMPQRVVKRRCTQLSYGFFTLHGNGTKTSPRNRTGTIGDNGS